MPFVVMNRTFEVKASASETLKYPAGWTGEVSAATAKQMTKTGAASIDRERTKQVAAARKAAAAAKAE